MIQKFGSERVFSPSEVAQTLRVSQATISRAIHSGKLKAFRVGSQWRILGSDVAVFVNAGTDAALLPRAPLKAG